MISHLNLFPQDHKGAMYLGLDVWQSANGFDILRLVLYCLVKEGADFSLESLPLDFFKLQQSHTGIYLAVTVDLIAEKFGVKDNVILNLSIPLLLFLFYFFGLFPLCRYVIL
jgi:hypothetical protein